MDNEIVEVRATSLVPISGVDEKRTNYAKQSAIIRHKDATNAYIPHLDLEAIRIIAETAGQDRLHGERNKLMIQTIFDGCFRVSEALGIEPKHIKQNEDGWYVEVMGKGNKAGVVAISSSLAALLNSYAYRYEIVADELIFKINRSTVFRFVNKAMDRAGISKPNGVGTVHVLRHSGTLERLKVTGLPKTVQDQLRHSDARMTLRYMKTLASAESLKIQQGVDFQW